MMRNSDNAMKSGQTGAHKPDKLGLICEANKYSDAGAKDLGVLTTHETSPCLGDAGSTQPGGMPLQVDVRLSTFECKRR